MDTIETTRHAPVATRSLAAVFAVLLLGAACSPDTTTGSDVVSKTTDATPTSTTADAGTSASDLVACLKGAGIEIDELGEITLLNGMQTVTSILLAVDASDPVVSAALRDCELLSGFGVS